MSNMLPDCSMENEGLQFVGAKGLVIGDFENCNDEWHKV